MRQADRKRIGWWSIVLLVPLLLLQAGCSVPGSGEQKEAPVVGTWEDQEIIDKGFEQTKELEMLGVGWVDLPNGKRRGVYLPYGGNLSVRSDLVQGANHGVSLSAMFIEAEDAEEAVDVMRDKITEDAEASGISDMVWQTTEKDEEYDAAICYFTYQIKLGNRTENIQSLVRTIRQEQVYLSIWVEYADSAADEQTSKLLYELSRGYGLALPEQFIPHLLTDNEGEESN